MAWKTKKCKALDLVFGGSAKFLPSLALPSELREERVPWDGLRHSLFYFRILFKNLVLFVLFVVAMPLCQQFVSLF